MLCLYSGLTQRIAIGDDQSSPQSEDTESTLSAESVIRCFGISYALASLVAFSNGLPSGSTIIIIKPTIGIIRPITSHPINDLLFRAATKAVIMASTNQRMIEPSYIVNPLKFVDSDLFDDYFVKYCSQSYFKVLLHSCLSSIENYMTFAAHSPVLMRHFRI